LKLLELREELLEKAFDIARADLAASTNDKKKYAILLQGLILQVRLRLLHHHCRESCLIQKMNRDYSQ
jgi:vacuolar-type H+-ATPase subunit E/Vma4